MLYLSNNLFNFEVLVVKIMNRTFKFWVFLAIVLLAVSCSKRYGCTDEYALNYEPKAAVADGSCWYEYKGAVAWSQEVIDSCSLKGVKNVNIFLEDSNALTENILILTNQDIYADYGDKPKKIEYECLPTNWPKYNFKLSQLENYYGSYEPGENLNDPYPLFRTLKLNVVIRDSVGNVVYVKEKLTNLRFGCNVIDI
jgi:hypothetical protein